MQKQTYTMAADRLPKSVKSIIQQILTDHGFDSNSEMIVTSSEKCVLGANFNVTIINAQKQHELCLFVKTVIKNKDCFYLEAETYFNNELVFYSDIVDQFLKLCNSQTKHTTLPSLACIGKCYSVGKQNEHFIIMENLIKRGYSALNVKEPLSLECVLEVLKQLGQLHAYSFAAKNQKPELFAKATSKLQETVFHQNIQQQYRKIFLHAVHDALKLAKQNLPAESIYVKKLSEFVLDIFNKMILLANGDDEDKQYHVVTHGDLWPNNMLYKFSNDNSEQQGSVVYVDFQGCRYASPAHDLVLILLVSIDHSTRERHREHLIRTYHTSLCETLEQLGSDPLRLFPYLALQSQIGKHARFALAGLPLYLDEGPQFANLEAESQAITNTDTTLDLSIQQTYARKTMKCKNKILEIIMEVVNQNWL